MPGTGGRFGWKEPPPANHHNLAYEGVVHVSGQSKAPVRQTLKRLDHAPKMERRVERLDLLHQLVDQPIAGDDRKAWNVVDRLFRVKFGALAAWLIEYVDQRGIEIEEPEFEH